MVHKIVYAAQDNNYDNFKGSAAQTLRHIQFVDIAS